MQDVSSSLHESDVRLRRVGVLTIGDRIDEAVFEFAQRSQQIRLHEIHHAVVYNEPQKS